MRPWNFDIASYLWCFVDEKLSILKINAIQSCGTSDDWLIWLIDWLIIVIDVECVWANRLLL